MLLVNIPFPIPLVHPWPAITSSAFSMRLTGVSPTRHTEVEAEEEEEKGFSPAREAVTNIRRRNAPIMMSFCNLENLEQPTLGEKKTEKEEGERKQ